jgi:hypothetical protein
MEEAFSAMVHQLVNFNSPELLRFESEQAHAQSKLKELEFNIALKRDLIRTLLKSETEFEIDLIPFSNFYLRCRLFFESFNLNSPPPSLDFLQSVYCYFFVFI